MNYTSTVRRLGWVQAVSVWHMGQALSIGAGILKVKTNRALFENHLQVHYLLLPTQNKSKGILNEHFRKLSAGSQRIFPRQASRLILRTSTAETAGNQQNFPPQNPGDGNDIYKLGALIRSP